MALIDIQVPDIGDFAEVTVIELLVKPGDTVKPEQSLLTVESDKASMEIPSSHGGVVKELRVKLGDKVKEGSVVLVLEAQASAAPAPAAAAPPQLSPRRPFAVAGRNGLATIKGSLVNMRDGGFISAHDFHIGSLIANVVCGGDVDAGTLVSEEYLMALERKAFCELVTNTKTQERIMGMMATGKPVRN